MNSSKRMRIHLRCSSCRGACEHRGAALSLILEEKLALGLSAPPPQRKPMESLSEEALIKRAVAEREQQALEEKMRLKSMNPDLLRTDYVVTNLVSGKSYRLALRGWQLGVSKRGCRPGKNSRRRFEIISIGSCTCLFTALAVKKSILSEF